LMYSSSSEWIWWPYANLPTSVMANLCVNNILNYKFSRRRRYSPSNQRIIGCRSPSLNEPLEEDSCFLGLRILKDMSFRPREHGVEHFAVFLETLAISQ
jgi:hypothetical protein